MSHAGQRFWKCYETLTFYSFLAGCRIPCACLAKPHLNLPKWSEHVAFLCVFSILTSKCASRHGVVHFFDIWTSKCAPRLKCFVHFDFDMCFAPQRCALFQHLNFQKCSEPVSFEHFWLPNVLRATTACTFSTSTSKSGPSWCVLCILTWKRASRHKGLQFFISHMARWLRTRHFSKPTFRPSGATNHWKNIANRDFSTFSSTCIFFPLTLSLLWSSFFFSSFLWLFPPLLFHLSICSEVWLLNFLRTLLVLYIPAKLNWSPSSKLKYLRKIAHL